jgi:hypothetical protein
MMDIAGSPFEALAYEAPFLVEKLLKEHIVDTKEEAEALFTEVKRYIVLVRSDDTRLWDMHSLRIDEAWHQFVLFTAEYIEFSLRYFGTYIDHAPSNAPQRLIEGTPRTASTFEDFQKRYAELFGMALPEVWYDERQIKPTRRILNDSAGHASLVQEDGISHLCDRDGQVLVSVNSFAHAALGFIAETPAFYVRELPGGLDDGEKVTLVSTLVEFGLLRVGS